MVHVLKLLLCPCFHSEVVSGVMVLYARIGFGYSRSRTRCTAAIKEATLNVL